MSKEIPLSNGRYGTATVDDDRYDEVMQHQWLMCLTDQGQTGVAIIGGRTIYLGHFIAGTSQHTHRLKFIDGDCRNCQHDNIATTYDAKLDATSRR